jgi:hypothetical protein
LVIHAVIVDESLRSGDAIVDALAELRVEHVELPAERVWRAIRDARRSGTRTA